ncbi:MAG TPA: hypothetical protein VMH30_09820 [Verrucomicrobiae bacterium]|nr:hypothetical protein [Verrucomicrobiae bacterium]
MTTTDTKHYRQGDVLIERIADIPTGAVKQEKSARIILAHGEATGHHHALETESPVEWFKRGKAETTNEIYVSLPSGGLVVHPEHTEIKVPNGLYCVIRQREYSPGAWRNVED